jgi:uncharacterized protein YaaR (DUF327 family)
MGMVSQRGVNTVDGDERDEFSKKMDARRDAGGFRERLKSLLERIDDQAVRLSERLDIAELKRYRTLVTEFVDITVRNAARYEKEHTLDGRGRHRVFGIVRKIDQELENLTQEVLSRHKDNIGVLAKLDDIRGMLVDIMA